VRAFLKENPAMAEEIERIIREKKGLIPGDTSGDVDADEDLAADAEVEI